MATGFVRKATSSDFPAIFKLIEANSNKVLKRTKDELNELIDTLWVAELDGEVVGCVCLEIYSKKIAELRTLAVREELRGQGYGKMLVQTVVDEAKRRKIPQLLTVTSTPEYFEQFNFGPELNEKYALFWKGNF